MSFLRNNLGISFPEIRVANSALSVNPWKGVPSSYCSGLSSFTVGVHQQFLSCWHPRLTKSMVGYLCFQETSKLRHIEKLFFLFLSWAALFEEFQHSEGWHNFASIFSETLATRAIAAKLIFSSKRLSSSWFRERLFSWNDFKGTVVHRQVHWSFFCDECYRCLLFD